MHTLLHKTEITLIFASQKQGVLAHLARARHWQCRGERFESAILHNIMKKNSDQKNADYIIANNNYSNF